MPFAKIIPVLISLLAFYEIIVVIDLTISHFMERHKGLWPMCDFYCVCGFHQSINNLWPTNTYNMLKILKHDKNCLSKLLYFWGSGITPKWQNYAAEEIHRTGNQPSKISWKVYQDLSADELKVPRKPFNLDDL